MNRLDIPPDKVVLDAIVQWTDGEPFRELHTAKIVPSRDDSAPLRLLLFTANHQGSRVQAFVDLYTDGAPEDGPPPRFILFRLGPTVWKVTPSLKVPGMVHAYLTITDVPDPPPWVSAAAAGKGGAVTPAQASLSATDLDAIEKNAQAIVDNPGSLQTLARWARTVLRLVAAVRDARAWVGRLTAEQRTLTCVYCGHAYPPGSPTHGAEVLTAHIKVCEKHPMRALLLASSQMLAAMARHAPPAIAQDLEAATDGLALAVEQIAGGTEGGDA